MAEKSTKESPLAKQMFSLADSYATISRLGNLYGRLNMLMDMKLHLADEEIKIRKQIKESELK